MAKGKILQDKENALLNRREIKLIIESEKNPTYKEAKKIIAEDFKAQEENISIKLVKGKFGRNTFLLSANIYKTVEDKNKIEPEHRKQEKSQEKKPAPEQETEKEQKKKQPEAEDSTKKKVGEEKKQEKPEAKE
jgi:ribosomal protein S24E